MTLEDFNDFYEALSNGVFPFVYNHKLTILEKGFYEKAKEEKYKGLACKYSKTKKRLEVKLFGYIFVPENIIIIPPNLEITPNKQRIIDEYKNKGYKVNNGFPSFPNPEFKEDSVEYKVAYQTYMLYKTSLRNDKSSQSALVNRLNSYAEK
jgi:hypothetical protein